MLASALVASLLLVPAVLATPYMTAPVASTTWAAGTQQTIQWMDDGNAPNLTTFGLASVGLYVGSVDEQIQLQSIATDVNLSSTAAVSFTPEASVGANGDVYFIRFTSNSYMSGAYPAEAFSAKFALSGMTGTFNATVSADIAAGVVSPIGGSSTTSPTSSKFSSSSPSPSAKPSGSAAGASTNGAMTLAAGPLAGLTAVAAVVFGAMLF